MPADPTTSASAAPSPSAGPPRPTPPRSPRWSVEIAAHEDQTAHVHVDVDQWRTLLARPEVIVLIAERDGQAVGYVSAIRQLHLWTGGDVINLDDLYVRPGHRDGGIGRRLMARPRRPRRTRAAPHPLGHGGRQRRRPAVLRPPRRHPAAQGPRRLAPSAYADLAADA